MAYISRLDTRKVRHRELYSSVGRVDAALIGEDPADLADEDESEAFSLYFAASIGTYDPSRNANEIHFEFIKAFYRKDDVVFTRAIDGFDGILALIGLHDFEVCMHLAVEFLQMQLGTGKPPAVYSIADAKDPTRTFMNRISPFLHLAGYDFKGHNAVDGIQIWEADRARTALRAH